MKAVIKNVKLMRIDQIWKKHKPQGLGFSDNDAIIVTLKAEAGKTINVTFYCRLKGDGTLGRSITKASEKRQKTLQNFIKKYISPQKAYDIRNNIKKWKGKKVELEKINEDFVIKI